MKNVQYAHFFLFCNNSINNEVGEFIYLGFIVAG